MEKSNKLNLLRKKEMGNFCEHIFKIVIDVLV